MAKEEPLIRRGLRTSDVLIFKANLVAHMKDGLSAFLFNWSPDNPMYTIDPFLYAFQQDPEQFFSSSSGSDGTRLKRSVQKLVDAYGDPLKEVMTQFRPVSPIDFRGSLDDFVIRASEFQLSSLQAQGTDLESFFTYLGMDHSKPPQQLIAASFSLDYSSTMEWLAINDRIARRTLALFPSHKVYAQIIVDQDVLWDETLLNTIVDCYNALPLDGVIIWISGMSEHDAPLPLLRRYLEFLSKLRHKKVIWFGSYFSVLLSRYFEEEYGVIGVAHGPGYGEDREVDPAGGGFPIAKFYFPALHRRLNYGLALMAARPELTSPENYFAYVCNCSLCRQFVAAYGPAQAFARYGVTQTIFYRRQSIDVSADIPTVDTQNYCSEHFLHVKEIEYHSDAKWEDAQRDMRQALEQYRGRIPGQEMQHLKNWLSVLSV